MRPSCLKPKSPFSATRLLLVPAFAVGVAAVAGLTADPESLARPAASVRTIPDGRAIAEHVIGRTPLSGEPLSQADRNADGVIDVGDVVMAIGPPPSPTPPPLTPTPEPTPAPLEDLVLTLPGGVTMTLKPIAAGSFRMGRYSQEQDSYEDEDPQHDVTIGYDFHMGMTEVTQAQWAAVMGNNPASGFGEGDNYPVYYVSWEDIAGPGGFIETLNAYLTMTSQAVTVRLPSEAEWEYCNRAGTTTRFYFGDSLDCAGYCENCAAGTMPGLRTDYMWYCGNNGDFGTPEYGSKPVASKAPNAFWLHDMSGNVREWCQDDWHPGFEGAPSNGAPWGFGLDSDRVIRGGGWSDPARNCRSARRTHADRSSPSDYVGFRLAAGASAVPTPTPTPLQDTTIVLPGGVTMDLVGIPAGTFAMGSPGTESGRDSDEGPTHTVRIGYTFWMGRTEVTQAQWLAVMGSNPSFFDGDQRPVESVSWENIAGPQGFIETLNAYLAETGQGISVRLPSESEWEYCCRAGTTTRFFYGDSLDCNDYCEDCRAGTLAGNRTDYMWYCGNNGEGGSQNHGTKPVAGKLPNAWGLYDMSGNVYEWCQDDWHGDYTGAPTDGSPWEDGTASYRVRRGGDWDDGARYCRSAGRTGLGGYGSSVGFRLAAGASAVPTPTPLPTPPPSGDVTLSLPGGVTLELVAIPSGTFEMGRYPGEQDSYSNEDPRHTVTIGYGFHMGMTEVTQSQWEAVMGSNPSHDYGVGDDYPVYDVSWNDIVGSGGFLETLSAHLDATGQGVTVRLPSESEWEYCCRAGTATRFHWGDDPSYTEIGDYAWYSGNNDPSGTKPVAGKLPNAWGLYDMSGNVYEWCQDYWHDDYTGAPTDGSPWGDGWASGRVDRGGDWGGYAQYCRSAARYRIIPTYRIDYVGFRLAAGH